MAVALPDDIATETGEAGNFITKVEPLVFFQHLELGRIQERADKRVGMGGCEQGRVVIERLQRAVLAHQRRRAHPHMHIRCARREAEPEEFDDPQAVRKPVNVASAGDHFDLRDRFDGERERGRMRFGLRAGLLQGAIGLNGGRFDGAFRRVQRLAQALRLFRRDDRLFQQKIQRRQMRHGLQRRHRRVILVKIDPAGMVSGRKNELGYARESWRKRKRTAIMANAVRRRKKGIADRARAHSFPHAHLLLKKSRLGFQRRAA